MAIKGWKSFLVTATSFNMIPSSVNNHKGKKKHLQSLLSGREKLECQITGLTPQHQGSPDGRPGLPQRMDSRTERGVSKVLESSLLSAVWAQTSHAVPASVSSLALQEACGLQSKYLNPKFCFYHTIEKSIFQTCQKASTLQFASFRSLMFWTIAPGTEKPHFGHRDSEHLHVVPALSGDTSLTVSLTRKERCEGWYDFFGVWRWVSCLTPQYLLLLLCAIPPYLSLITNLWPFTKQKETEQQRERGEALWETRLHLAPLNSDNMLLFHVEQLPLHTHTPFNSLCNRELSLK